MTALYDCSPVFRSLFAIVVLICLILTSAMIIFAFLRRKKLSLVANSFSFILDFFVLLSLNETAEHKIGNYVNFVLLNILHKPFQCFILILIIAAAISAYSLIKNTAYGTRFITGYESSDDDYLLCRRAEQLQRDNIRLTEMNRQMKLYGESMQEQIRQKEILQAKMRIHNGMNKLLMISSRAVESGNEEEIQKAMSFWHNDAVLLCMESESEEISNVMHDIEALAEALHMELICNNIPETFDEKTAILFEKTACEAMLNSVKHANADVFEITVTDNCFSFANNGEPPSKKIQFGGGLTAINQLAAESGYEISVECNDRFILNLRKSDENAV